MRFWVFIVRRLLLLIPVLIGVMTITFLLVSAVPTIERIEASSPPPKTGWVIGSPAYNAALTRLGLNQPVWTQYGIYLYNTFTLQWGYTSPNSGMVLDTPQVRACSTAGSSTCPVLTLIQAWLPYTIELAAVSLLFVLILAIPLGNYSAVYRNRPLDQATRIFSFSGFALPAFLLGSLLIILYYTSTIGSFSSADCASTPLYQLIGSWPPSACWAPLTSLPYMNAYGGTSPTGFPTLDAFLYAASHSAPAGAPSNLYWTIATSNFVRLFLPAITVAYGTVAGILRFVRSSMLEVMNLDFIRTARAKGVSEGRVIRHHAGRNSLNVTVTVLGLTFAGFLSGFPVIEDLFNLTGVGRLFTYALLDPIDYGTIFASTVLFTIIIVIANVTVDIVYGYLDPRVRLG